MAALVLAVFASGYAVAAGLTIVNGTAENGSGVYHTATNSPPWWSESAVGFNLVPAGLTTLSGSAAAPTRLAAASSSYAINGPTTSDVGHHWNFQETTAATVNTELELQFELATGGGGGYTLQTVFVETQTSAPGSTLTFTMWFDLGTGDSSPRADNVQVIWLVCSAVGTCP